MLRQHHWIVIKFDRYQLAKHELYLLNPFIQLTTSW